MKSEGTFDHKQMTATRKRTVEIKPSEHLNEIPPRDAIRHTHVSRGDDDQKQLSDQERADGIGF